MIATISNTTELLQKYDLKAKKKYGQNFLISSVVIDKVISLIEKDMTVIEIGAGLGAITQQLALKASKVIAYEIDKDLFDILKKELDYPNLVLLNEDFLKSDLDKILNEYYGRIVFVSNLPYYLTSEILTKIFLSCERVEFVIAMMQKEVADRFLKQKVDKQYSPLQVLAKYCSDMSVVSKVNRNNFIPAPNVDSVILRFEIKEKIEDEKINKLYPFIKDCFTHRRKPVLNNLIETGYCFEKDKLADIKDKRVEQLSMDDYLRIYEEVVR